MTINCKGQLIDLTVPKIMGILNVTPDSFFDGGQLKSDQDILSKVEKMRIHGATFIDLGGYGSRPDATNISGTEELQRVVPAVDLILKEFPDTLISIDTFRSKVAEETVAHGAAIVNDISAGKLDSNMLPTVAKLKVPYIMMHMKGTPQTMKSETHYDNLLKEILFYFSERLSEAKKLGIVDMIIDPGFGFAKTREQNFELLSKLELFKMIEKPLLAGISRKSFIYKTLDTSPDKALNGTSVLNTVALQKGATILRVHDVKEAAECIQLISQIK
ncbi:MAG TPA: dihydropteroate synthase [Mangrovimonas sp.]|nr:dihydropteroate synthase [Mangrovimonas sp.]